MSMFGSRNQLLQAIDYWLNGGSDRTNVVSTYGEIENWTFAISLTDFSELFKNGRNNNDTTSFNEDISNWDVSNVIDMNAMFEGAINFNQDISGWDVSNVTDMSSMFEGASNFNQDISDWDVSNVTDMSSMFNGATSFNQDISDWERTDGQSLPSGNGTATSTSSLGNVNYAESMFEGAINFDQDISGWDLSTPVGKNSSTNTGRYKMFLNSGIMNNNTNWWEKMPRFKPDNHTTICLRILINGYLIQIMVLILVKQMVRVKILSIFILELLL